MSEAAAAAPADSVSSKLSMSLDDIIASRPKDRKKPASSDAAPAAAGTSTSTSNGGGRRSGPRSSNSSSSTGGDRRAPSRDGGPIRGDRASARGRRRQPFPAHRQRDEFEDDEDDEDNFQADDSGPFAAAAFIQAPVAIGSGVHGRLSAAGSSSEVSLVVGNLAANINKNDMSELFANNNPTSVNIFSAPGSDTVIAHVVFSSLAAAKAARDKFHGLQLDNRVMVIGLITSSASSAPAVPQQQQHSGFAQPTIIPVQALEQLYQGYQQHAPTYSGERRHNDRSSSRGDRDDRRGGDRGARGRQDRGARPERPARQERAPREAPASSETLDSQLDSYFAN